MIKCYMLYKMKILMVLYNYYHMAMIYIYVINIQ